MPHLLLDRAKTLRSNQTDAELKIWHALRANRLEGFRFKRQKPLGAYILDFVCDRAKLVIELDGSQHLDQKEYDAMRDQWLKDQGYEVLRFWNNEVFNEFEAVLEKIHEVVLRSTQRLN